MIVVRTPFRLPIGGGGTDLPSYYKRFEGSLITAAINKYMYININEPAIINKIKINYTKAETVELEDIDKIEHDIVRETLKYLKLKKPLEISSMADLSAGTGMGSSSTYTVGLLRGLTILMRRHSDIKTIAEEACKIEMDLIGNPIGKQDQYAAAFGGIIQMDIDRLGNVTVNKLDLHYEVVKELENRLMLFYTNLQRDANRVLKDQNEQIDKAKIEGNSSTKSLEAMHRIKEIGYEIKERLLSDDIDGFGKLMHEHWMVKKSVSDKISNKNIDDWYELAIKNGALGGKITGAGGGGFFLFCVENGNRKHLRKTMEDAGLKYMDFRFDFEGSKVLVNI